jgi:DNA-binding transcriptional LysR family regulator
LEHEELETVVLGDLDLVVALPPYHRFAHRQQIRCKELENEEWITFPEHNPGRLWLQQTSSSAGFTPRVAEEVETLGQMTIFVETGAGIALIPPVAIEREVASGSLAGVKVVGPCPKTTLCMALRTQQPSPAVRAISELLRGILD